MNATLVACTEDGQVLPFEDLSINVVNQVRDDSDDLLTQREAAALAKVDPRTIRRWIAGGYITPVRIGPGHARIRKADLLNPRKSRASR